MQTELEVLKAMRFVQGTGLKAFGIPTKQLCRMRSDVKRLVISVRTSSGNSRICRRSASPGITSLQATWYHDVVNISEFIRPMDAATRFARNCGPSSGSTPVAVYGTVKWL